MISLNFRKLSVALTTFAVIGSFTSYHLDNLKYRQANTQFLQEEAGSKINIDAGNLLAFNTDELPFVGTRGSDTSPNLFIVGNVRANE